MSENRRENSKSIARNVVHNFSSFVLPLVLSFIATPFIVKLLGHEDYGIYSLAISFIAYSFNFNVGRAITKYVAEYRVRGESGKISEVIAATLFINLAVGGIGLIAIISLANVLAVYVLKIPAEALDKTVHALYIAALTIFFLMLFQLFTAILQGVHRFDVTAKINNVNNVLLISGNLVLALAGFGLVALLIWNLLVTVYSTAVAAIVSKRLLPEFSMNLKFRREMLVLVFKYSSGVIAYQLLANILLLFERSWITGRLGAESLTYYVVPMMLAVYLHAFFANLMTVMFPLVSELKNEPEKLLRLYQKATKTVSFLAIFIGATMMVESRQFLTLWMGADFAEKSAPILILLTLTFTFLAIKIVSWQLAEGLGYPSYNSYFYMICFIISVFGMIWLINDYGNFGVAIARAVGFGALFLSTFYAEKLFLGKVQLKFWLRLSGILAIATALSVAVESLLIAELGVSWLSLIVSGLAGGVAYCLTAWVLGFVSEDEIALIKGILKR